MTEEEITRIAKILKWTPTLGIQGSKARENLAYEFAEWLGQDNPRFDAERFVVACTEALDK